MAFNFKDASLLSVLQTQITGINVRTLETPLTDITYPTLVPVNNSYQEWQPDTQQIVMGAGVGEAKWISGGAKDVPLVETSATVSGINFAAYTIGYEVNYEELGLAAQAGINISNTKALIARRKAEEFVEARVLTGDADKGWSGLINQTYSGVTILQASTKAAGGTQIVNADGTLNATPSEIARDMVNLILGPVTSVNSVRPIIIDTVAVPSLLFRVLASTFTDALQGGISILEFVRRQVNGAVPNSNFQIIEIPELATAATTGIVGGGRIIGYRRSVDVLELPVAFAFRFLQEYKDAPFGYMVPGWSRIGAVTVWNPRAFRYLDAVSPVPA